MARGDHIYVNRVGGVYSHHGIDCGDGSVIHYHRRRRSWRSQHVIERTDLASFSGGEQLLVRDYSEFAHTVQSLDTPGALVQVAGRRFQGLLDRLRGIALAELDFSPDAVVARARSRLGESRFDLATNNCEHFAAWCKTGLSSSSQIDAVWRLSLSYPDFVLRRSRGLVTRLLD